MKKAIIVDDEMLVRVGLRTSINWEKYGFVVEGEARNGKEAIEKFSDSKIDLLITDIAMPEMDGLELSKFFLNINKDICIIILTHHENFAYAKKAIELGVSQYILKSDLDTEHFEKILRQISNINDIDVDNNEKARYLENKRLMTECLNSNMIQAKQLEFINDGYYFFELSINNMKDSKVDEKAVNVIIESTLESLKAEYYLLNIPGMNKRIIVFDSENDGFKNIVKIMDEIKNNLEQILGQQLKYDYTVKYHPLNKLYNHLLQVRNSMGISEYQNEKYPFYVNKAFEFINNNYRRDISLNDVAEYCELNASYLSNLIRKETGITYSKYLNMLRIKEAKHLLESTNMKVYEVSMYVGIDNQYYFGKLFKEITGITCSEYRARLFEKDE
ncbi:response regulator transcription factor [Cellulosilyticum sp. I15G10I2]|uniref:response regulator transcription factor n=1 Tax=Cellulosilyticum sp. I15G10I2 TaxID=1892843 RepID=UPI00085CB46D|nr:response regulator [Cellulosilyticum sp. I15G10I2]